MLSSSVEVGPLLVIVIVIIMMDKPGIARLWVMCCPDGITMQANQIGFAQQCELLSQNRRMKHKAMNIFLKNKECKKSQCFLCYFTIRVCLFDETNWNCSGHLRIPTPLWLTSGVMVVWAWISDFEGLNPAESNDIGDLQDCMSSRSFAHFRQFIMSTQDSW